MSPNEAFPRILFATALVSAALALSAGPASAGRARDSYPPDGENPLRITSYFLEPVGNLLEWTVTRPLAAIDAAVSPERDTGMGGFKGCSRERPARSCTDIVK